MAQGISNLLAGDWVARRLDVPFDSHTALEAGILLVALGGVALAGALVRQWLDLAVVAGVPVGLAFAVGGASELAEFPAGGVLHLSQGVAAVALAVLWWRAGVTFSCPARRGGVSSERFVRGVLIAGSAVFVAGGAWCLVDPASFYEQVALFEP